MCFEFKWKKVEVEVQFQFHSTTIFSNRKFMIFLFSKRKIIQISCIFSEFTFIVRLSFFLLRLQQSVSQQSVSKCIFKIWAIPNDEDLTLTIFKVKTEENKQCTFQKWILAWIHFRKMDISIMFFASIRALTGNTYILDTYYNL